MKNKTMPVVQYSFAILVLLFTLAPIAWMFVTSISYHRDLISVPLKWIPPAVTFQRYIDIFTNPNNDIAYAFKIAMFNSLIVCGIVTLVSLIVGLLASYAFARLKFVFKEKLMYLILFTFMVPSVVLVIPLYLMVSRLGMLDSKITLTALYLSMV
ncbi:MAG: carbohydrate ABC transporter permease, partial [Desulfobacteraceae bacterium]